MKLFLCRISFLPSIQKPIIKQEGSDRPIILLERQIPQHLVFKPRRYGKGLQSLEFGDLVFTKDSGLIAGKLGKMKGIRKFNYDAGKFDEEKDVSHPYINFFWDRSQQVIIIEKNSSVFPEIDKLITSIEAHFNNILTSYELTVKLVPLTEMYDFWKVMTEYEAVFEVRFELFMPNFLGRTNEAVKEFLTTFQADYNTSSLNITFKNAEGYFLHSRNS